MNHVQWDVKGKIDGMGADSAAGQVIVTVNEDNKSSLYTVSGGTVTHYTYTPSPLPHLGGTDNVAVDNGKMLISASAAGTAGKAPASAPAVYVVTLNSGAMTATAAPFFANSAPSTCPAPGYPANSLGTIDLTTGTVSNVPIAGVIAPKGMVFVP